MTDPDDTPASSEDPVALAGTFGLRDFLTDGSLARLCAELSRLTGARVELRDDRDRPVSVDGAGWKIGEPGGGLRPEERAIAQPLDVGGVRIGEIVSDGDSESGALRALLPIVAQTATEWCTGTLELRQTIDELGALIELSSLLVGDADVSRTVDEALRSVLRVLGLDAGSVVLFPEDADGIVSDDERGLELSAAHGLSSDWLRNPQSLSQDRVFDRLALAGEVVAIRDLHEDERVRNDQQVADERVRGFMCAGLLFRDRPVGVIRVYTRAPRTFTELDKRLLRGIAQQTAAAVHQSRLLSRRTRDAETERQVRLAAAVQHRMLPRSMPSDARLDVVTRYQPSFDLGGDFCDVFAVRDRVALVVGDVAGKGVPAAMLMSLVRASFRAHAERGMPAHEVLASVNRDMCRDTLVSEFATIWFGQLDPADGRLSFSSAGHEPPIIVRADGHADDLPIGGLAAGIDPEAEYTSLETELGAGDILVAFTDGVPDVMSFDAERYGKDRLRRALAQMVEEKPASSAADILDGIFREMRQFGGLSVRPDDATVVVARYLGSAR